MSELATLEGISKHFGGISALTDVDFSVRAGEIHALVGENGAGKSTLMGVLSGRCSPDRGTIVLSGTRHRLASPAAALAAGVGMINQELVLAPDLTVAENIFMGRLPRFVDWNRLYRDTRKVLSRLGVDIAPSAVLADLPLALRQMVEIAKALSLNSKLVVFDEPTAVLPASDAQRLLQVIRDLRDDGVGVVYISHRLDEIMDLSDRVTILKDGRVVETVATARTSIPDLVRMMVGRPISSLFGEKRPSAPGREVLRVEGLCSAIVKDVSFSLHAGEIVGLGGLVGSGRTETARLIFGADRKQAGTVVLDGRTSAISHPADAVANGIGLVPEDRRGQGLVVDKSVRFNLTLTALKRFTTAGVIGRAIERRFVDRIAKALRVKMAGREAVVRSLSGGNQQKVVIGKWLEVARKVVILDEPTRGVDVGARSEIYGLIRQLADQGKAILVISSDHHELFGLCDRIIVMGKGSIQDHLLPAEYGEERLLASSLALA